MSRPPLELADVFRRYGPSYREAHRSRMTTAMVRVMRAIELCRTAALGGHVDVCPRCGYQEGQAYNSCRNRHCPKCQAGARAEWVEARLQELLPVTYFHVVFTLPACLAPLALLNKRLVYNILFQAASKTLIEIAADPKHLGARIGFFTVLHTWGQTLMHHPHLHCIVPGGGLSPEGDRWIHHRHVQSRRKKQRKPFFLPVRVLSARFRNLFLGQLLRAYQKGRLRIPSSTDPAAPPFAELVAEAKRTDWVVYAKPPFGGPEQVLAYLGRYTHRVAISNSRLLALSDDGKVTFCWKDYRQGHANRTMTLDAHELIRRFLLHVLPDGFQRIRHYGFLGNRCRDAMLTLCRKLLGAAEPVAETPKQDEPTDAPAQCPTCHTLLVRVELPRLLPTTTVAPRDTS